MDQFDRPTWDDYFMAMAFMTCTRSLDTNTKHACILVDQKHRVLGIGYNGPIRGVDDEAIPTEAPEKYFYMEHSERNAVFNSHGSLEGSTAYITGFPCTDCMRALIQNGVVRIYWGPIKSTTRATSQSVAAMKAVNRMACLANVEMIHYDHTGYHRVFNKVFTYLEHKGILSRVYDNIVSCLKRLGGKK